MAMPAVLLIFMCASFANENSIIRKQKTCRMPLTGFLFSNEGMSLTRRYQINGPFAALSLGIHICVTDRQRRFGQGNDSD